MNECRNRERADLNLLQALVGAVSRNFRRVTVQVLSSGGVWLRFLLEHEDEIDRDEIAETVFEFEALQTTGIEVRVDVIVDNETN